MMVTIRGNDEMNLELFPEDETVEIVQNILCILNTTLGSCPGIRNFGIDPEIYHKPMEVAQAAFSVSIKAQMEEFEPRASLANISFVTDPNNPTALCPILEVTI